MRSSSNGKRKKGVASKQEFTYLPLAPTPEGDFIAAIGFLAVLAFPMEIKARNEFVDAAKGYLIKKAIRSGHFPRARARKKYSTYPERRIWETGPMRRATRRISKSRLPAAATAIAMVMNQCSVSSNLKVRLTVAGSEVKSVNSAAMAFGRSRGMRDTNWIGRNWTASKPVLHLALALHAALEELDRKVDILHLVEKPMWVRNALKVAEEMRRLLLPLMPQFRFGPHKAIVLLPESECIF